MLIISEDLKSGGEELREQLRVRLGHTHSTLIISRLFRALRLHPSLRVLQRCISIRAHPRLQRALTNGNAKANENNTIAKKWPFRTNLSNSVDVGKRAMHCRAHSRNNRGTDGVVINNARRYL